MINMPKSSPASLVNLGMILQALNIARRNSINAVQTQTLSNIWLVTFMHLVTPGSSRYIPLEKTKEKVDSTPSCPGDKQLWPHVWSILHKSVQVGIHDDGWLCNS